MLRSSKIFPVAPGDVVVAAALSTRRQYVRFSRIPRRSCHEPAKAALMMPDAIRTSLSLFARANPRGSIHSRVLRMCGHLIYHPSRLSLPSWSRETRLFSDLSRSFLLEPPLLLRVVCDFLLRFAEGENSTAQNSARRP